MAMAHMAARIVREFGEQAFIKRDRPGIIPQPRQHRRLQVAIAGMAGGGGEQPLDLGKRRLAFRLAVEDEGIVEARRIEIRRQHQRPRQQPFRFAIAPQPAEQFGHHAQRIGIGGVFRDPGGQRRFGLVEPVLGQRIGGTQQARVTRRRWHGHDCVDGAMSAGWQGARMRLSHARGSAYTGA